MELRSVLYGSKTFSLSLCVSRSHPSYYEDKCKENGKLK